MSSILKVHHTHPLEREYESWIVHGIEKYFEQLGLSYAIWAVSPKDEVSWPADEKLATGGKVIGLQFKQAKLATGPIGFDRLKWSLHTPPGQFSLIQSTPEIFYCLPTFINRSVRTRALDHCLFWRPDAAIDHNVWYDNSSAHTPYKSVKDQMRWGRFIEAVLSCTIGKKISSPSEASEAIASIYSRAREYMQLPREGNLQREEELGLYVLVISIPG